LVSGTTLDIEVVSTTTPARPLRISGAEAVSEGATVIGTLL